MARKTGPAAPPLERSEMNSVRKYLFRLFERGYDPNDALQALKIKLRADAAGEAARRQSGSDTKAQRGEGVARGARDRRNADE